MSDLEKVERQKLTAAVAVVLAILLLFTGNDYLLVYGVPERIYAGRM